MQNLYNDLIQLLQKDERFTVEGKLLKNTVIEASLQLDPVLMKLLLSHESLKKNFFKDVDGILVFDKIKFQKFVSNKSFLPDSYTAFSNKIGLTVDDEFISENKDVALSWPHKDCVLEGGQTKEDEKRDEIFWNETLAPDEIDRLLSPKVFTNLKKYDGKGEHKVTDITLEDNLIIKGNNLLVLTSLLEVYRGAVSFAYFDPPYNTESDTFLYNDSFSHSAWLTFMKNRLRATRDLLKREGVLFINIGDEEVHYLKILCDEVFGRNNFVNTIARVAKTASNKGTHFAPSIDFVLCYAKDISFLPEFYDEVDESLYKKIETTGRRKGERYRDDVALFQSSLDSRPNQRYFIECPDGSFAIPPGETIPIKKEDGAKVIPSEKDGVWRWSVDDGYFKNKQLLVFKETKTSPLLN
ncbi:MAG: site-specific DNA-methyltransferase [Bacteroidota bacterium]|nr:site-specific DNA-methyltransferase [Bacteroidota bacterium]